MRVIFAGTPEFARVALALLHAAGFDIPLVLTQPDRPAGRGLKLQASSVKQFALDKGMDVIQPRSLRLDGKYPDDAAAARAAIEAVQADAMVVAAYGLILPQWVLDVMGAPVCDVKGAQVHHLGCFNIHASLLPRWRGAAPIHRAIEAGDTQTGITIMQMDVGLDTGDILQVGQMAITPGDTTGSLHDRLAVLGGRLMVDTLALAAAGSLAPVRQPEQGVTYAHKISKQEAAIDWTEPAAVIERRIRAFNPFPGAAGVLAGETIKFWQAAVLADPAPQAALPGQVLAAGPEGVDIATGAGVLRATRLQKPGGKPLDAADFVRGFALQPGACFQSSAGPAP